MSDGEWLSAPKGDLEKDDRLEVVHEDGRPSFFRENEPRLTDAETAEEAVLEDGRSASVGLSKNTTGYPTSQKRISLKTDAPTVITASISSSRSARSISDKSNEKETTANPFTDTGNPIFDPKSSEFSARRWLEAVMGIVNRDPQTFPKREAGVAFTDLSVHAFGTPTDYQRNFANQVLALVDFTKRLFGIQNQLKVNILRGFEGLVKSGEMLVVLGRPGRQESTEST